MKQMSQYKFAQHYDFNRPNDIVRIGTKRFITDDLYIIRSTHKSRNYNYREDGSAGMAYDYKPCWKLLSQSFNEERDSNDEHQMCLMSWTCSDNDRSIYQFRRDILRVYGPTNSSRYPSVDSIFDWLYYTLNPITLHHGNGNLKRGFANHLIKRLNGFGKDSPITVYMIDTLVSEIVQGKIVGCSLGTATVLFNDTDTTIEKVRKYLGINYHGNSPFTDHYEIQQCPLTKVILPRSHMLWKRLSGVTCYIRHGTNLEDFGYHSEDGEWVKENEIMFEGTCYDSRTMKITRCEECNGKCVTNEMRDGMCVECLGQSYRVNNYSLKVEDTLGFDRRGKSPNEPYLGVEMEFQVDKHKQGRLYTGDKLQDHALMKDDGSISNGFEIVTRPSGYFTHINKLGSFLDDLPDYIHPHSSCGMHVHISRTAFTWLGAGKFTEFFNRVVNKNFIKAIAGRGTTSYSAQDETLDIKAPYNQRANDISVPRYNFVNLQNSKTIELRIFATPANKLELEIRMQFVKAMIEYCKPAQHTVSLKEQTHFKSFVSWLTNTKNEFEKLNNFIKESALCV
jgi:hypothetical protein